MTMKLSPERGLAMPISELGQRRQVVIPKQICDELGLEESDFVEVERQGNKLVLTPKRLVEKHPEIDRRLAEAEEDIKAGQVSGPFAGPSGLPEPPTASSLQRFSPRWQPSYWVILHHRRASAGQPRAGLPLGRARGCTGIISVGIVLALRCGRKRHASGPHTSPDVFDRWHLSRHRADCDCAAASLLE
jgi:AbrB family looped-hinge helix DNA binding protein